MSYFWNIGDKTVGGWGVFCLFPLEKVMGKVRQKLGKKERKCFVSVPRFTQEGITTKKFNEI